MEPPDCERQRSRLAHGWLIALLPDDQPRRRAKATRRTMRTGRPGTTLLGTGRAGAVRRDPEGGARRARSGHCHACGALVSLGGRTVVPGGGVEATPPGCTSVIPLALCS